MKVTYDGDGKDKKLFAKITVLRKLSEPADFTREANFITVKGPYEYFQTPLSGYDVRQSTYAVSLDGSHIYVTNTFMDAENIDDLSSIMTYTYLCQQVPFN